MNGDEAVVLPSPAAGCLGDWRSSRLQVRCNCHITKYPVELLMTRHRLASDLAVGATVARLRCPHCGERRREARMLCGSASAPPHGRAGIAIPVIVAPPAR
jgi:hypothetical protein